MKKEDLIAICKLRTLEIEKAVREAQPIRYLKAFYFDENAPQFRAVADKATENTIDYLVNIGVIKNLKRERGFCGDCDKKETCLLKSSWAVACSRKYK